MPGPGHPNEGQTDAYYGLTANVDFFGIGASRLEVPIPLLVLPSWILLGWALARGARAGGGIRSASLALLCLAVGTLPLPVLITTAGGLETQAFALAYFLGFALCGGEIASRTRPRLAAAATALQQSRAATS